MKSINVKIFTAIYDLHKKLGKKLDNMKQDILNGATLTQTKYAKIQIVDCTRSSYSKEDQKKLDEYAMKNCIAKQVTHYKRIDIDNISIEIENITNDIINTLEDSNDKTIARVASKVATVK